MNIQEFTERTGFYPSLELYAVIETHYMEQSGDKDAFCKAYKENTDRLAEKIQREATLIAVNNQERAIAAANELRTENEALREKAQRLIEQLEREQEWKPYENTSNVSQAEYEKLAQGAKGGISCHYMTDDEAIKWICDEFDFDPSKITIVHEIDEYEISRHNLLRKTGRKIDRRPVYCATDYHYIRFNTSRWYYEVWDDQLRPFYD